MVVRPCLTGGVPMRSLQCGVEVLVGLLEAAKVGQGDGQVAVGAGLLRRVAQPAGSGQPAPLGFDTVVPAAVPVQDVEQRARQVADLSVVAVVGGAFRAASRAGRSAANQANAASGPVKSVTQTPGLGAAGTTVSMCPWRCRVAAKAVWT
jgi:hypothetical protein